MTKANREARARFGANVEILRQRSGLSLDALAERSQVGRDELTGILSGQVEARAGTVYLLAGALGVHPGELFHGMNWVPPADGGGGYVINDASDR
jgi:transcriptional regulator with XRE-family HTH domain